MAYALPEQRGHVPALRRPLGTMLLLTGASALFVGAAVAVQPLAGLAGVIAVALALALAQRPVLSATLMVTVAPAAAGLKRGLVVPGLRVSEVAIAGLACLVLVFAARVPTPRWSRTELALLLYATLTAALGGLDLALRHAPLTSDDLGGLLGPLQFLLLVRAIVVALPYERQRMRAVQWMLGAAALIGLIALMQAAKIGFVDSLLSHVTGSTLFASSVAGGVARVTGPFNFWHELAGFLMPSVLLSLALLLAARTPRARLGYGLVLALTGAALLATASGGPLIATVLACLYLAWARGVLHVVLAAAIPVVIVLAIGFGGTLSGRAEQQYSASASSYRLPLVPETLSYRYAVFHDQSVPALEGHWATGYGPDLPPQLALGNFPYTETIYVSLLLRGGVPLLVAFLIMLAAVGLAARREQRAARTYLQWSIATVVLAMTVAYVLLQLIESYLLDSGPPHVYWSFVGLMLAAGASRELGDE
jgi:hypothetical protein